MSLKIVETVTGKLSPRDRRALRVLGVFVAALVVFLFVTNWFGHWVGVRKSLAEGDDPGVSVNFLAWGSDLITEFDWDDPATNDFLILVAGDGI